MTKAIFLLSSLLAFGGQEAPAANLPGLVLGVEPGLYRGTGILRAKDPFVPNLRFVSERRLADGVIEAATTASLYGMEVASAKARLEVQPRGGDAFELWDLEAGKLAGEGSCDERRCSFVATVMGGRLTLKETWEAMPEGFQVVNASQNFGGIESTYEASFVRGEAR